MGLIKYNANRHRPMSFNSFVDRFFDDEFLGGRSVASFKPQVDISETESAFEIELHIPGVNKDEISIDIEKDQLVISGERKRKEEKNEKNFHSVESYYGTFRRSFYVPDTVNSEKIEANYADGILSVTLPKDEKKIAKKTIVVK